jgi:hypothetical protein
MALDMWKHYCSWNLTLASGPIIVDEAQLLPGHLAHPGPFLGAALFSAPAANGRSSPSFSDANMPPSDSSPPAGKLPMLTQQKQVVGRDHAMPLSIPTAN